MLEANITGDLAKMKAGTLSYALGADYRKDSYSFKPDNLSQNENFIDPIAGLFPNQNSGGDFDVKELYGELLIPSSRTARRVSSISTSSSAGASRIGAWTASRRSTRTRR